MEYREFDDFDRWSEAGAGFLLESIKSANQRGQQPVLCLAGGKTPFPVYARLANLLAEKNSPQAAFGANRLDTPLLIIPGDERLTPVSPEYSNGTLLMQEERNEVMLREAFKPLLDEGKAFIRSWYAQQCHNETLKHTGSKKTTVRDIEAQGTNLCARMNHYISKLQNERQVLFDCVVLGIGADGHIAGIFTAKTTAIACATEASACFLAPSIPRHRMSLLPHILRNTQATLILLHKKGKEHVLDAILKQEHELINISKSSHTFIYCYDNTRKKKAAF